MAGYRPVRGAGNHVRHPICSSCIMHNVDKVTDWITNPNKQFYLFVVKECSTRFFMMCLSMDDGRVLVAIQVKCLT